MGAVSERRIWVLWVAVAAVFVAGSGLSLLAWSINRASEQTAVRRHFEGEVRDVLANVVTRMAAHEQLLRAGIALFASSDDVSRGEWQVFGQQMRLQEQYPGLTALGYAPVVAAAERSGHEQSVRATGLPAYSVHPEPRTSSEASVPALYLEPSAGRDVRQFGRDLSADAAFAPALEQARDTGEAVLTSLYASAPSAGRPQAEVRLFMPIYRVDSPVGTVVERRQAVRGYVFASLNLQSVLDAALTRESGAMALEVFDGQRPDPAQRLYEVRAAQAAAQTGEGWAPTFEETPALEIGQRRWTLRFTTLPAFDAEQPHGRAGLVLLAGMGLTLLVTVLVGVLAALRSRALALAGRMTDAFRRSEMAASELARLNAVILHSAPFMVLTADAGGTIRTVNPAGERMLQFGRDDLTGRSLTETLMQPEELEAYAKRSSEVLGAPMPAGSVGVLAQRGLADESEWNLRRKDGSFLPVNLALAAMRDGEGRLAGFVGIGYDITERKKSEEYILHLAHHDALTGLPNRVLLQDRVKVAIERGRRQGSAMAVVLLDLDRFKQINDSLGHFVGDTVLKATALRLAAAIRNSDTVARMGGDEFCLVLSDLHDVSEAISVASKVLEAVRPPIALGQEALYVTASIGIAMFPRDGADLSTLLQKADTALYRTKDEGRNGYRVFDESMQEGSLQRLSLEADLRGALERGELVLHYQPKVRLDSGEISGVEALLRWNSPVRGMIAPGEFIALAEETGLIVPIGAWVLRQACADAVAMRGLLGRSVGMAVNLSPRQFRDAGLAATVGQALHDSGLAAEDLELEITEGVLMDNTNLAASALAQLHGLGVQLAIDDFGTGFSSLSYLHRFPVSTLKIDRSFVAELDSKPQNRAIVASVIGLGQALGLHVVAEGVETRAECELLRRQGCPTGQGYLFSRPLALPALLALLQQGGPLFEP